MESAENVIIPASALAELRTLERRAMPHVCTVHRRTTVREPGGVTATTYQPDPAGPIPCRLAAVSASERVQAEQPASVREWVLILEANPALVVAGADRLVITGETDGVPWTETVRVLAAPQDHAFRITTRMRVTDLDVAPIA